MFITSILSGVVPAFFRQESYEFNPYEVQNYFFKGYLFFFFSCQNLKLFQFKTSQSRNKRFWLHPCPKRLKRKEAKGCFRDKKICVSLFEITISLSRSCPDYVLGTHRWVKRVSTFFSLHQMRGDPNAMKNSCKYVVL